MAVFYQTATLISRGAHTCSMATAAYRSGSKLTLSVANPKSREKETHTFDYSHKTGIAYSKILAPKNSPEWIFNRQLLWQKIEDMDSSFDANLAIEFIVSLPEELNTEQNIDMINEFVNESIVSRGMIADVNFHNDHSNNVHLHIMCPIYTFKQQKGGTMDFGESITNMLTQDVLENIRSEQAEVINKHLYKHGFENTISHLPDAIPRYSCLRPWL